MLQVISGKFFSSTDLNEYEGKAVLFSNYHWIGKIDTCVGSIEPVFDPQSHIAIYILQYLNRIEKAQSPAVVRIGDSTITNQFRLLCTFWFNAYFNTEKSIVDQYCQNSSDLSLYSINPGHVSRIFDKHIYGVLAEAEGFPDFVQKVIDLDRKGYEHLIGSLFQFFNALELSRYNIDLAYSMLVYVLESFAQSFDNFRPSWDDYDPSVKGRLNVVFNEISHDKADEIRDILISSSNFKTQQRFIDFFKTYTADEFFITQSQGLKFCIRKSELEVALKNAYRLRSNYTHELQPIQEQLRSEKIAEFDTFHWDGQPYLTFKGLFRLARHVIAEFISSRPRIEREEYGYYRNFPGSVLMEMSPYLTIVYPVLPPDQAAKRLSGLLLILENAELSNGKLTDIRDLLTVIRTQYPQMPLRYRPILFAMYYLYNLKVPEEIRSTQYDSFIQANISIFDSCSPEALISLFLTGEPWNWDSITCEEIIKQYLKRRYSPKLLRIPLRYEMGMITNLANRFFYSGRYEKYVKWLQFVITDLSGQIELQNYVRQCLDNDEQVQLFGVIRGLALAKTNSN